MEHHHSCFNRKEMTKKSAQEKMTKVCQKIKDKSGNNAHIFSLFLSTLLTRPVSLNVNSMWNLKSSCIFINFASVTHNNFFSRRSCISYSSLWGTLLNIEVHGNNPVIPTWWVTWLQKDLMHAITVPPDQSTDEMGRPMLNHIISFCSTAVCFLPWFLIEMSKVRINLDLQKHHIKCATQHNYIVTPAL